jgi:hypothetical protein
MPLEIHYVCFSTHLDQQYNIWSQQVIVSLVIDASLTRSVGVTAR